ncbi:MAG: dual specificity protein phosphatase family protein, partial [Verrucomicrobiota bacterium]
RQGPVYVHCAAGRGRSALVVAAFLLAEQRVETVGEAVEFLQRIRPEVLLVDGQRARLEEYAASLGGGRAGPPERARFHPFGPPNRPGG